MPDRLCWGKMCKCAYQPQPIAKYPETVHKGMFFVDKGRNVWIKDVRRM
jgi:hypothetical protein